MFRPAIISLKKRLKFFPYVTLLEYGVCIILFILFGLNQSVAH